MTFEELSVYLHEPKPQEPRSFTEADITSENLLFRRDQVEVHLQEVLSLHQGISKSLRVIPHPRYRPVAFHVHDFYELMYVYKGTVCHHLKDADITLRETDAILFPAWHRPQRWGCWRGGSGGQHHSAPGLFHAGYFRADDAAGAAYCFFAATPYRRRLSVVAWERQYAAYDLRKQLFV